METQFNRFKSALEKMLMLDQADLDFGIYRIMNQKREDIETYLNNKLKSQVTEAVSGSSAAEMEIAKIELNSLIKTLVSAGSDPEYATRVIELRAKLAEGGDTESLENEVYSHLTTFFSRYYDGGDFISQRRYKKDVYAIPYEGEEVKLHWANADQYYIKTGEYFRNYRFSLSNGKSVEFTLKNATVEQNNNIAQDKKKRRFALYEDQPIDVDGDILHINFTYELQPTVQKQDALIKYAYDTVKGIIPADFGEVFTQRPTDKDPTRTILQKHLKDYVARNTFDYFIHKDLYGFLSRELDFYVKNEILVIDDIDEKNPKDFVQHLAVIKAIKTVGKKIITFLASLEDFQKKLWLKKKFVVQADYCITLDRVPEELYPEICANDKQREEWVKLFSINEINSEAFRHAYTVPLTVSFLKENPFLILDTALFASEFKNKLLTSIENIDEFCEGMLISSENFQALRQLQEKYREKVNCIYIDPPYNTENDGFLYKDGYSHSSWLSMMNDRLRTARELQNKDSAIFVSINENEVCNLEKLLTQCYGEDNYLSSFIVKVRHEDRILKGDKEVHEVYENLCLFKKSDSFELNKREKDNSSFDEYQWEVEVTSEPQEILTLGDKTVEVYNSASYRLVRHKHGTEDRLKRISVRGSIREGNSSGRFYVANLEVLPAEYQGCLFKVEGIGAGKLPYRWFWLPDASSGRRNGDYFQDVPINKKDIIRIPYPNYVDFEKEFNNCTDEGGVSFRNGKKPISFLKHVFLLGNITYKKQALILDFFAGSGSTGHAVINLNREDGGSRKYILCEMGEYFNTVTKPRIQKVIYSKDWKDGKPVSREGSSHCFKYMRLEQYEDTLNNLVLTPLMPADTGEFYDSYMLGYLLDTETKGSLFNLQWFRNPWNTKLLITRQNETKEENVDLIETFNYLIGLNVESIRYPKEGLCTVEGVTRTGERTLIIWRNVDVIDNEALNRFFKQQAYSTRDTEFDRIYVNGDNNLENLRTDEENWKVVLTEKEFAKRMFEDC